VETFEVRTTIAAGPDHLWRRVTTPAGINDELLPLMRMTTPATMKGKTIADVVPGSHLGRSWLLLFGVIPFDYDDIGIAELDPGRRFLERSSMLSMNRWEHERTLTPATGGCELRDRVAFELRGPLSLVPGLSRLLHRLLRQYFQHRHRRVSRWAQQQVPNTRT
jgi:ligand-binding SRPBCC domain-containing protein